ncbi:hypothetical protein LTR17_004204 [Elasticomyces elasticus]|nr:hypothetical protein LTR17_004204 [Elasticomyces elasticus]
MAHKMPPSGALAEALQSFSKPDEELTRDQRRARRDCRTLIASIEDDIKGGRVEAYSVDKDGDMAALVKAFGRLFFCGKLDNVEFRPLLFGLYKCASYIWTMSYRA